MTESPVGLRSALVSDVLDQMGYRHQCLPPTLTPLSPGHRLFGTAFPVQAVEIDYIPDVPYVGLLEALDAVGSGQVFVLGTGDGSPEAAGWGELLSTACLASGAVGAVVDAPLRDAELVQALGFPVFSRGRHPTDCHGRLEVVGHGEPVRLGCVNVHPGDLVVGDADGVVVVPGAISATVLAAAAEKGSQENLFRAAVARGMKPTLAFERFRVL